jgi:hypothetical protein
MFFFPRTSERGMIRNVLVILMKLEILRQVYKKCSNTRFRENPSTETRVVPCGWTDGKTHMNNLNSRVPQFCECTKKYGGSRQAKDGETAHALCMLYT